MKTTLQDVRNAQAALQKLLNQDLKAKVAFKLARLAKAVGSVYRDIEDQRAKLIRKYGEENKEKVLTVKQENVDTFRKEFDELLAEEVSIEWEPISIDLIADASLTPLESVTLDVFFTE